MIHRFKLRKVLLLSGLFMLAVAGTWLATPQPKAEASTFGRPLEYGYYDGNYYTLGAPDYYWYSFMFESGLPENYVPGSTTVDIFVNDLRQRISNSAPIIDQARASMIINVMMGVQAQDPRLDSPNSERYRNGIALSRSLFTEWERIVRAYSACTPPNPGPCTIPGASVQFNEIYALDDTINGYGVGETGGDPQIPDVVFAPIGGSAEEMIVFRHPNGTTFTIKKKCGNLTGDQSSFPNMPPTGQLNPPTSTPGTPPGYNPGNPSTNSSCSRITGWARDPNDATFRVPVTITFRINGSPPITLPASTVQASNASPFAFGLDTPPEVRSSLQSVRVTATGTARDGTVFTLANSPMTIGPCQLPQPSCGSYSIAPSSLDPGTQFTVNVSVSYDSGPAAQTVYDSGGRIYIRVSGPGFSYNQTRPTTVNGTSLSASASMGPTNNVGVYSLRWGVTGPSGAIDCADGVPTNGNPDPPVEFPVTNKPYFKVEGGDVSAGLGMTVGPANCTAGGVAPNNQAGIVSWNRNNNPAGNYDGAGTTLGALTRGRLQDFATAQTSNGGADKAARPRGLAFSNVNNPTGTIDMNGGLYGGKFDGGDCVPDYFANIPSSQILPGNYSFAPAGGTVTVPGFPAGGNIANGDRRTIYVDGNLYINSNVAFSGNYPGGIADIPSFVVIVRGNIYIDRSVSRLDGFYIAQPAAAAVGDNTRGNIYTCAAAPTSAAALDRNLHAACNTALTVNGSFSARQVWLLRTAGTVSSSTAAESFNYVPDIWIAQAFNTTPTTPDSTYDSITSLPPNL